MTQGLRYRVTRTRLTVPARRSNLHILFSMWSAMPSSKRNPLIPDSDVYVPYVGQIRLRLRSCAQALLPSATRQPLSPAEDRQTPEWRQHLSPGSRASFAVRRLWRVPLPRHHCEQCPETVDSPLVGSKSGLSIVEQLVLPAVRGAVAGVVRPASAATA